MIRMTEKGGGVSVRGVAFMAVLEASTVLAVLKTQWRAPHRNGFDGFGGYGPASNSTPLFRHPDMSSNAVGRKSERKTNQDR